MAASEQTEKVRLIASSKTKKHKASIIRGFSLRAIPAGFTGRDGSSSGLGGYLHILRVSLSLIAPTPFVQNVVPIVL